MTSTEPQPGLMQHYQALQSASDQMLQAARAGQWGAVCRLESTCAQVLVRLRQAAVPDALSAEDEGERARILAAITANDREIRRLFRPRAIKPAASPAGPTLH